MPDDPIAWAREQAARAEPVVHAAAMLWIARVQTPLDSGLARITFEMALEETRRRSGRDCEKRRFYEKVALVKGDLLFFVGHLFLVLVSVTTHVVLHRVSIRTLCEPLALRRLRSRWRSRAASFESAS